MYGILCICFVNFFDMNKVREVAIIAEIKIVVKIVQRFAVESCVICDIAEAAPVRDF